MFKTFFLENRARRARLRKFGHGQDFRGRIKPPPWLGPGGRSGPINRRNRQLHATMCATSAALAHIRTALRYPHACMHPLYLYTMLIVYYASVRVYMDHDMHIRIDGGNMCAAN